MHYRVRYSLDFDLKIRSGQVWILWIYKLHIQFFFHSSLKLKILRYVLPFENEMKIEIIGKEYEWRELYKNSFHVLHFYRGNFRKNCKELYSVPRFLRILNIFAKVSLILASMKGLNLLNVVESRYEPRI